MSDDPRDCNHGEILSFIEKTNEAENPERLIGFFVNTTNNSYPGLRTADDTWIRFADVRDVRRVPVIQDPMNFVEAVVCTAAELSRVGLGDEDRRVIAQAIRAEITNLFRIPPEPPQWTTVKVTYHDPTGSHGWDYYFRDLDRPDFEDQSEFSPATPRWTGPGNGNLSWAEMQKIGKVEIMPAPKHEED